MYEGLHSALVYQPCWYSNGQCTGVNYMVWRASYPARGGRRGQQAAAANNSSSDVDGPGMAALVLAPEPLPVIWPKSERHWLKCACPIMPPIRSFGSGLVVPSFCHHTDLLRDYYQECFSQLATSLPKLSCQPSSPRSCSACEKPNITSPSSASVITC